MSKKKKVKSKMEKAITGEKKFLEIARAAEIAMLDTPMGEIISFDHILAASGSGSFGRLTPEQEVAVKPYVEGKKVFDLGSGRLALSKLVKNMGAQKVIAIDRDLEMKEETPGIEKFNLNFYEYLELKPEAQPLATDVAFVSWPNNRVMQELLTLARACDTIIYLGKNTDGSSCAWPGFFNHMLSRKLLVHIPDMRNTLLIYGKAEKAFYRDPVREELGGLNHTELYDFKEGA